MSLLTSSYYSMITKTAKAQIRAHVLRRLPYDIVYVAATNIMPFSFALFTGIQTIVYYIVWYILCIAAMLESAFFVDLCEVPQLEKANELPQTVVTPYRAIAFLLFELIIVYCGRASVI